MSGPASGVGEHPGGRTCSQGPQVGAGPEMIRPRSPARARPRTPGFLDGERGDPGQPLRGDRELLTGLPGVVLVPEGSQVGPALGAPVPGRREPLEGDGRLAEDVARRAAQPMCLADE